NESFRVLRESPSVGTIVFQVTDARSPSFCRIAPARFKCTMERRGALAREQTAKHVRKMTLKPVFRTYVATGIWDWLGVMGSAAVMVVPGARIELATPAFSGRRSTTELPRQQI